MEMGRRGADRQEMHEVIREHSLVAWKAVQEGQENPLVASITADSRFTSLIPSDELILLLDASVYVGDAPQRARQVAAELKELL